jgi:hypothetical protein
LATVAWLLSTPEVEQFTAVSVRSHHRDFMMAFGEMDEAEFIAFLTRACALHARYSANGSLHFVFMPAGISSTASKFSRCPEAKFFPQVDSSLRRISVF